MLSSLLQVGQKVRYIRNGKEHSGRITSLSACTCGLAGHVDCRCGSKKAEDHTIPLLPDRMGDVVPKDVFCMLPLN